MTDTVSRQIDQARRALAEGRTDEALALGRRLLATEPDSLEGIELKATAEQGSGDWQAAEQTLRNAIAAAPHLYPPFEHLVLLLQATGRQGEAEILMRHALALHPSHPDAHGMFGVRLAQRGALVEANRHLREALRLGPRHAMLLAMLGHNLVRLGEVEEAETLLAEATAADPEALLPMVHYARTLERARKLDEAKRVFSRVKSLAARDGHDVGLQEALLLDGAGDWRGALALLEDAAAPTGSALLTRGRLKDRDGRYEEAWADFVAGKARRAAELGLRYDRAGVDAHLERLAGFFSPARFAALPGAPTRRDAPQPIFVMGFPRSGTTMTEQLLSAHSRIRAGGELPFTAELVEFAVKLLGRYPDGLSDLVAADRRHIATLFRDFYLARAETYGLIDRGIDFFTDKMPLNELYLPLLRLAFPEARVITVRRHPLDILVSVMGHNLTHGFNCGFAVEDAAHHLAAMSGLLAHWRDIGIDALAFRYEDFVLDQTAQTERLMAYVGLEVEPAQLEFHTNRRLAPTPSYAQVREPLYDRSIGRWRHYAAHLEPVLPSLAEAMTRDSYSA